ncbi:lipopolysaccharide kinase InaA family protein [Christiangramia sp. SM2212]|uniref:Lipopolysaccharide kinase InaA family protein n=1 Tax=Christiangramia sediminicola TaxID=3073267 RepID=A0ABU1ER02_9FLAO|nr:lipopolysaccharide kinase InaA family protein [Christiangramia sp. SM2212]MDR5590819.1 lipopolysaccharide kinase InaA family protein [Christiangramia sp. SM2212]
MNFESKGVALGSGIRNSLRIFDISGYSINIKSFKKPNLINKIVYKFFRKSKAERSYRNALTLLKKNIGTPMPLAYAEEAGAIFGRSFYASENIIPDLTFRDLVTNPDYPDHEKILRAFTRFTYELHEKQVQFLDHSPGNTLIRKKGEEYEFFLVDLNRMNFKDLNFEERMINFSRLTPKKEMVEIMADEYAALINKPTNEVFEKMWFYTNQFQEKFKRKKELKKKLKFWKN